MALVIYQLCLALLRLVNPIFSGPGRLGFGIGSNVKLKHLENSKASVGSLNVALV